MGFIQGGSIISVMEIFCFFIVLVMTLFKFDLMKFERRGSR